jgi:glutathione S-transferase
MKLHLVVGSPNSRKVLAVAHHIGLDVDIEYHDFFAGDLHRPDFVALNPNGMVPVLVDRTFALTESNAIMQYLADITGHELFPRDPQRRADVVRWQCWELAHFNKALGILGFELFAKPTFNLGPTDHGLVNAVTPSLTRFAAVIDGHMHKRNYAVGDRMTIADYSLIHLEGFKDAIRFDWTPYPHLNRYFDRMRQDPHWARTAPPSPAAIGRKPKAA